jgi:RecA/RadA recombinase
MKKKAQDDDLTVEMYRCILARQPRKKGGPAGVYEVMLSTERIPSAVSHVLMTGLAPFDDLTGGFPMGRIVEIYGLESCGKTNLVLRAAYQATQKNIYQVRTDPETMVKTFEKLDPDTFDVGVCYIDNEQSLDEDNKIYVDGKRLYAAISRFDTIDNVFKTIEATLDTAVRRQKRTGRKQFVICVVDTVASTSTRAELEMDWSKDDYPRTPAAIKAGFRVLTRRLKASEVEACVICTNQVSDNFAKQSSFTGRPRSLVPMDDDYVSYGGKALKYFSTHRIFMYRLSTRYKFPGSVFPDGFMVGFTTTKNRIKKPMRDGRMVLLFREKNGGFNNEFSLLETLLFLKCAKIEDDGIRFRFKQAGVELKTFKTGRKKLDDEDEEVRFRGDPRIEHRGEWLQFYADHREDLDALWRYALDRCFRDDSGGLTEGMDEDDYEPEEEL